MVARGGGKWRTGSYFLTVADFWSSTMEKVLEKDGSNGCPTIMWVYLILLNCTFINYYDGKFYVCFTTIKKPNRHYKKFKQSELYKVKRESPFSPIYCLIPNPQFLLFL